MAKPKHGFTEPELELLTDEEREGLEDTSMIDDADELDAAGEDAPEEDEAAAGAAGEEVAEAAEVNPPKAKKDPKDPPPKPDAEADTEEEEEVEAAADADAEAGADAETGEEDEPVFKPTKPIANYIAPAYADKEITGIDDEIAALDKKFDEGEMERADYNKAKAPLQDRRDDLREAKRITATALEEYQSQTMPAFWDKHPEYEKGSPLYAALDAQVHKIQAEGKYNPFDPAVLELAHHVVMKDVRKIAGGAVPKKEAAPKPETKPAATVPPKRPAPPPNIGKLPAADMNEATDGGEFAAISRLTGVEFEDALAKLTDEQRDRYYQSPD
jgi:hypothetical protein